IATGATLRAARVALRRKRPQRLIGAVPVAPRDVVDAIASLVDEVVCLEMPEPFYAVGLHYDDFEQLEDQDVITALDEAATFGQRAAAT
ncbi:MAG: phosphoribosyltransferase, partial [Hyphomicrobiaceae bacterium]